MKKRPGLARLKKVSEVVSFELRRSPVDSIQFERATYLQRIWWEEENEEDVRGIKSWRYFGGMYVRTYVPTLGSVKGCRR